MGGAARAWLRRKACARGRFDSSDFDEVFATRMLVRAAALATAPALLRCARACSSAGAAKKLRFKDVLRPELVEALRRSDIFVPNAVQAEALPAALGGDDLIVCAQTGSGKTLLFLLSPSSLPPVFSSQPAPLPLSVSSLPLPVLLSS